MANENPEAIELITVTPPIPQFEFRLLLPSGWRKLETPKEELDFTNLAAFLPLGIFIQDSTFGILSIAARPGYGDGTLLDWLKYVAGTQSFEVETLEPFMVSAGSAASAIATQENDAGKTRMRVVALEDGGNFFTLTGMTPIESWDAMKESIDKILSSFTLAHPQGPTIAVA